MKSRRLEYLVGFAICLIAFVVYVKTLCPTVSFIDSGELATVAYTLGIAHPTGYPLFTLLGWFFSHLPLGLRTIYQLNLMTAFLCTLGLFFFFRFLVFLLKEILPNDQKKGKSTDKDTADINVKQVVIPAAAGTLFLAFSETYWSQALAIEVYSLHVFFLAILLLLFTKAIYSHGTLETHGERRERPKESVWYLFAFVLGLSFTNHMTTILLAPAFLYLYFYTYRFSKESWLRILKMAVPFLAGFSVYLYLPMRSEENPLMNWGNPTNLERFLWHFSGKVYRVWLFSSTESAGKQLSYFFNTLLSEFSYLPYFFVVIGAWKLLKLKKIIFTFTLLLFLGCVLYSINYDIHDIDSYFLLAYMTIAVWSAIGVRFILNTVTEATKANIVATAILASVIILIVTQYKNVDESKSVLVEEYTRDMFESIQPDGIIISYQWDYFVSAAYYFQHVEHVRPDVVIIDKELLRRTWYFNQLQRQYPWLIKQSKSELEAFLVELHKFEHDLPYSTNLIEYRYTSLIKSIIEKNYSTRPIYVTEEIENQYTQGYQRIPAGLAHRLSNGSESEDSATVDYDFHLPEKSNKYTSVIISMYAHSYFNHAAVAYSKKRNSQALELVKKALELQPDLTEGVVLRDKILNSK